MKAAEAWATVKREEKTHLNMEEQRRVWDQQATEIESAH
jgi:hypothetical protein